MSLNTKGISSASSSNVLTSQKSDIIKAELAKYRLLKSKGALASKEETKDSHAPFLQNQLSTIQSPSRDDMSQSSVMALLQLNSSQGYSKNEYYLSSSTKANLQPSPSPSDPSLQVFRKSFGGATSDREIIRADYYNGAASVPGSKVFSGAQTPTTNKSLGPNTRPTTAKKRNVASKSIAPEERQKEVPLSQIEDFMDSDVDKELIGRVYPKSTHHTSRTLKSAGSFSRSHTGRLPKEQSPFSRRTGSNVEVANKNWSEKKGSGVKEDGNKKSFLPESPKGEVSVDGISRMENIQGKNGVLRESRERKTAIPSMMRSGEGENEDNLKEEIEKWRIFGKMMAESYDDLNKKYTDYMKEKEKDKKIVSALKDQIVTLKALLQTSKEENVKLKDMSSKSTSESSSRTEENLKDQREIMQLTREVDNIKAENKEAMKMMDMLKLENQALKKALEESHKQKETIEHYKKLADARFKECSALAEEIICLRTDLDRSHSNYLRIQREQSSGKKGTADTFYSGKKARPEQVSFFSNTNSAAKPRKLIVSEQREQDLEESDDLPPSPEVYKALPSKEENLHLRG